MIASSSYNKSQKSRGMTKVVIILSLYSELHCHKRNGHPKIVCLEITNALRINGWPVFVWWLDLIIIRSPSPVSPGCSSRSLSISVRHDEAVLLPFLPAPTNSLNVHQLVKNHVFRNLSTGIFLGGGLPTQNPSTHSSAVCTHLINPFQSKFTKESVQCYICLE